MRRKISKMNFSGIFQWRKSRNHFNFSVAKNSASSFPPINQRMMIASAIFAPNMASSSDVRAALDLINGVERNEQLASIFLQLAPGIMPNTQGDSPTAISGGFKGADGGNCPPPFTMKIKLWHPLFGKKSAPYPDPNALFFQ